MDASLCVGGAMASTAVSKTVDPGSSPGRRATPPSSFLAHRGFGSGGGWRRFRNVAQLAARAAGGREAAGSSPAIPTWGKPGKTELARMRAKYAAWLERDGRLSPLAAERRRKRPGGEQRRLVASPRKPLAPRLRGSACMTPPHTRGLRPGPWATPPPSGMPEVPAAAVRGPAMRRGGRMRTPDTKGAHHVRSGRTQTQIHRGESR